MQTMTVQAYATVEGVEIINICDLMDAMGWWELEYDVLCTELMQWCKDNGASYYGACREDFWTGHGVARAKAEGNTKVVVEDLS